jgi:Ca2+-binding EF-hand superfamily protein
MQEGQVTAWFSTMDIDGNGNIDLNELTLSEDRFESLCLLPESLDESEFFTEADEDQDGRVTLLEHTAALRKL